MNATQSLGPMLTASFERQNPLPGPTPRASDEHAACRREIQRLLVENARLAADLSTTRARYHDLKRSAEMWLLLYERQLESKEQP